MAERVNHVKTPVLNVLAHRVGLGKFAKLILTNVRGSIHVGPMASVPMWMADFGAYAISGILVSPVTKQYVQGTNHVKTEVNVPWSTLVGTNATALRDISEQTARNEVFFNLI